MARLKKKTWKAPIKVTKVTYVFDTVEDTPYLCTVHVSDGEVTGYEGVYALDAEIVRALEKDGVKVPASCRY